MGVLGIGTTAQGEELSQAVCSPAERYMGKGGSCHVKRGKERGEERGENPPVPLCATRDDLASTTHMGQVRTSICADGRGLILKN